MSQVEPNDSIWKALIVSSFVMLSMLTWAASPLQKLVEKVQHKETIKAQMKVCSQVRAMFPVYQDWVQTLWMSGCIWQTRNLMMELEPKNEKEIEKQIAESEGPYYEKVDNLCRPAAAAAMREHKIAERVAYPMYMEHLKCPDVYDEAKKLGIEEEDVQQ